MGGLIPALPLVDLLCVLVLRRRPVGDALMRVVTRIGNPTLIIPIAAFFSFGLAPALHHARIVAAWSLALSHAVVHVLKRSVRRARPKLPVGALSMIEPEDLFSLPSGHAAAGLSVALPLFMALTGPVAYTVLVLGLLIGVSRCYKGVHHPGDVVVGWALAAATVAGTSTLLGV